MKQHAIPQNILDIEFKLFSKFTIKEFVYIASGIGFGSIFLFTFANGNMPGIIAIPIFLISSLIGVFFGVVKINDQKADVYFKNFIVAITSPTLRVWRSKFYDQKVEASVLKTDVLQKQMDIIGADLTNSQAKEDLEIADQNLDSAVKEKLTEIEKMAVQTENMQTGNSPMQNPPMQNSRPVITPAKQTPPQKPIDDLVVNKETINAQLSDTQLSEPQPLSTPTTQAQPTPTPTQPITPAITNAPTQAQTPTTQPPIIETTPQSAPQATSQTPTPTTTMTQPLPTPAPTTQAPTAPTQPTPPTDEPNIVTLNLLDKENKPVAQAVAMIKNEMGSIIQAKVSDENGTIAFSKSLQNGKYYIDIQHASSRFPRVQFQAEGLIYKPIVVNESIN